MKQVKEARKLQGDLSSKRFSSNLKSSQRILASSNEFCQIMPFRCLRQFRWLCVMSSSHPEPAHRLPTTVTVTLVSWKMSVQRVVRRCFPVRAWHDTDVHIQVPRCPFIRGAYHSAENPRDVDNFSLYPACLTPIFPNSSVGPMLILRFARSFL